MARLTDQERSVLVRRFMAECAGMSLDELQKFKSDLSKRMAAGRYPLADLEANFQVLAHLTQRIKVLNAENQERREREGPTAAEQHKEDVQRLARIGGVSAEAAEGFIRRRGNPFWDASRKDRQAAPAPEPAEGAQPNVKEKLDLRPYR